MQHLDLFAEFSNHPATVAKFATVENHIVDANKKGATEPRPDHIPESGKMALDGKRNVITARIMYEQWGRKELRVTDRKTGHCEITELRGILYETLLENLFWRFKVIGKSNAHEYVIYAFMRKILSDEELLNEKQRIDDIVHSRCKDAAKCRHRNQTTWHEHLNNCIRRQA